jgi:hypothetical protein
VGASSQAVPETCRTRFLICSGIRSFRAASVPSRNHLFVGQPRP